jgi:hypothetical protein
VKRYGEEMTRHSNEENLLKCSTTLPGTKPFENIADPINNNSLLDLNLPTYSDLEKKIHLPEFNKELTPNLENPMVKLHDIEKKEIKNNQIKINLDIDLYQMEEY